MRLILASASPRRRELLDSIGLTHTVIVSRAAEDPQPGETPRGLVLRLAEAKAREVADRRPAEVEPGSVVLGADTAVVLDGRVLGKPRDEADALAMLQVLRGKTHEVLTGVFVLRVAADDGAERTAGDVAATRVTFRDYTDEEARAYVASGEPLDKAGAYGIQGGGAELATGLDGSWSNVVGLPLELLRTLLERVG